MQETQEKIQVQLQEPFKEKEVEIKVALQEEVTLTLALILMGTQEGNTQAEGAPQARVQSLISSQEILQQEALQFEQQPSTH